MNEINSMRKSNQKTFDLGNGLKRAKIFGAPVHYQENDKWLDIDLTVEQENNWETEYCITKNVFKTYFNDLSDADNLTLASFDVDGNWINYKMVDANPDGFELLDNGIRYNNVQPNVDLEYIVTSRKLKENIIIKDKTALLSTVSFSLKKDQSLYLSKMNDGSVQVLDENYKMLFFIEKPYMMDANGERCDNVEFFIDKVEYNGIIYDELKIVADEVWMNDDARVFPINIDPTTTIDYNDVTVDDSWYTPGFSTNHGDEEFLLVDEGSQYGAIKYETKLTNHTLNSVYWYGYNYDNDSDLTSNGNFRRFDADWDEDTITGNNYPNDISTDQISVSFYKEAWSSIDMTTFFENWYDGSVDNYGWRVSITSSNEDVEIVSKDSTNTDYIHYIEVDYTTVDIVTTINVLSTTAASPSRFYNEFSSVTFNYDSSNTINLDKYRVEVYNTDDEILYNSGLIDVDISPDTDVTYNFTTAFTSLGTYKIRVQSITDDGITGETSIYTGYSYFSIQDTPVSKYNKITVSAPTYGAKFDKVRVLNRELTSTEINALSGTDEYAWDEYTEFYAEFNDNLVGGSITGLTSAITGYRIVRTEFGAVSSITVGEVDYSVKQFYDYRVENGSRYTYDVYAITDTQVSAPFESEEITADYYGWFLIDEDTDTVYKFDVNLTSGTLNNDTDFTRYSTYNRTDAYSHGQRNMISGSLSALFNKECSDTEIVQSNDDLQDFKDFVNNSSDKYLKDRRGRIWKVQTNGVPETLFNENIAEQLISISFAYYESGDVYE